MLFWQESDQHKDRSVKMTLDNSTSKAPTETNMVKNASKDGVATGEHRLDPKVSSLPHFYDDWLIISVLFSEFIKSNKCLHRSFGCMGKYVNGWYLWKVKSYN